jgi:hypothetical protein
MQVAKDLQRAWSDVLFKTAQHWVYNCDSGCFAEVCEREVWTEGSILVIYQPHKSMKEYDDMYASIFFKRTDKKLITGDILKKANLEEVDRALLASYNDYLAKTGNKWTHKIDGSLEQLVQIKKPLELEKGTLKMTFEIRGATNGCCGDRWWPHKLLQWQGSDEEMEEDEFLERCTEDAVPASLVEK